MIAPDATLSIARIPIEKLLACEVKPRYLSMVMLYVEKLHASPHDDAGLIRVKPCRAHPGLYCIDDGYHRYVAYIIVGRADMLCIVIEESSHA